MPGSKKGERRGNAKRRSYPTPNEVMRDAVARPSSGGRGSSVKATERRIEIARIIHGHSGDVRDLTPREVLLDNMHFFQRAAYDRQEALAELAGSENPDAETIYNLEREIEKFRNLASEDAFRAAPFVHPRLAAVLAQVNDANPNDIVKQLLEDIDARQRQPKLIEQQITKQED